jgi:hypothetical protein
VPGGIPIPDLWNDVGRKIPLIFLPSPLFISHIIVTLPQHDSLPALGYSAEKFPFLKYKVYRCKELYGYASDVLFKFDRQDLKKFLSFSFTND